jgi:hypothetical protein
MDDGDADALRAERDAAIAAESAAKAALSNEPAKGKNALGATVHAQRGDYWEDVSGRYLSIEGTTTEAQITCSGTPTRRPPRSSRSASTAPTPAPASSAPRPPARSATG